MESTPCPTQETQITPCRVRVSLQYQMFPESYSRLFVLSVNVQLVFGDVVSVLNYRHAVFLYVIPSNLPYMEIPEVELVASRCFPNKAL